MSHRTGEPAIDQGRVRDALGATDQTDGAALDAVQDSLRLVIDPELGENVVDLGLIYAVTVADGVAHIEMTTTTPGCPAAGYLQDAVQAAASTVPGIQRVELRLTYDPAWSPDCMSGSARRRIGAE